MRTAPAADVKRPVARLDRAQGPALRLLHHAARRSLLGQKPSDICRALYLTPERFRSLVGSATFKRIMTEARAQMQRDTENIARRLDMLLLLAVDAIRESLLQRHDPRLRQEAAEDLLDRRGFPKLSRIAHERRPEPGHLLPVEELERLRGVLLEIRQPQDPRAG